MLCCCLDSLVLASPSQTSRSDHRHGPCYRFQRRTPCLLSNQSNHSSQFIYYRPGGADRSYRGTMAPALTAMLRSFSSHATSASTSVLSRARIGAPCVGSRLRANSSCT